MKALLLPILVTSLACSGSQTHSTAPPRSAPPASTSAGTATLAAASPGAEPVRADRAPSQRGRQPDLLCVGEKGQFELFATMRAPSDKAEDRAEGRWERFEGDATITMKGSAPLRARFAGTRYDDYVFLVADSTDQALQLMVTHGTPRRGMFGDHRGGHDLGELSCSGPLMTDPPLK